MRACTHWRRAYLANSILVYDGRDSRQKADSVRELFRCWLNNWSLWWRLKYSRVHFSPRPALRHTLNVSNRNTTRSYYTVDGSMLIHLCTTTVMGHAILLLSVRSTTWRWVAHVTSISTNEMLPFNLLPTVRCSVTNACIYNQQQSNIKIIAL